MEESSQGTSMFGPFRLEQRLDSSGAFETYQASGPDGQTVVVKILRAPTPETVSRLTSLLRVGAPAHPNLVPVLDWGEEGGDFYVVRDYVVGTDLEAVVRAKGALSVPLATGYVQQAAAAVAAVQSGGLVHGNVKTANLLLPAGSDQVKVVGFGTAAVGGASSPAPDAPAATAAYLSPEQIQGQVPTARSDVYSLGVVLFELLTGKPPFEGANAAEVAQKHLTAPPSAPSQVRLGIPPAVDEVVERALQKDPAARYGSAEEMHQALGFTAGPPPAQPHKRKVWAYVLVGVVAALLIGALIWSVVARNSTDVPDLRGLTLAQATASLNNAQLSLGEVTYQPDPPQGAELGTVIGQTPEAAARVQQDSTVAVTIAGQKQVEVPNVVGQEEAEAGQSLQEAGLALGGVTREPSTSVPAGTVTAQTPSAGSTQPEGTSVALVVSTGPPQAQVTEVPDVVGESQSAATQTLEAAGFEVGVTETYSTSVAAGSVISQSPQAGSTYEQGGTVTLTVSRGSLPYSQVPDVVGQDQQQATQALEAAGFKVTSSQGYSPRPRPAWSWTRARPEACTRRTAAVSVW